MKRIKRDQVRNILINFAELRGPARLEFLGAMNEFLFASPQRRRVLVSAWKEDANLQATPKAPEQDEHGA